MDSVGGTVTASLAGTQIETSGIPTANANIDDILVTAGTLNASGTTFNIYRDFTVTKTGGTLTTDAATRILRQQRGLTITQTGVAIPVTLGQRIRRLIPAYN